MKRLIIIASFVAGLIAGGCGNQNGSKINSPGPDDSAVSGGSERINRNDSGISPTPNNTIDSTDTTHEINRRNDSSRQ